jgi:hypothetical protein
LCQKLLSNANLPGLLLRFDGDIVDQARAAGCEKCGGRLDSARYPRKPRGATTELPEEYGWRFSLCCDVEGCRKRHTPASVRFLGRRVYLGAVVVLAAAMQQGATPARASRLRELLGVSLRTLARWREWWKAAFVDSAFWKAARAFLSPPVAESCLPLSLLERFGPDEEERLVALLKFLRPLSTPAGYVADLRF